MKQTTDQKRKRERNLRRLRGALKAAQAPRPKPPQETPAPPRVAMCPLNSTLPLSEVGVVVAYVAASRRDPAQFYRQISMVPVGHLNPSSTIESATERFGGGPFYFAFFKADDHDGTLVGESFVVLPGPRHEAVTAKIAEDVDQRTAARKRADEDRAKDAEFTRTLQADEDVLVNALAEIHHSVVHARFAGDSVETNAYLAKALDASERGMATVVKRLRVRPGLQFSAAWAAISTVMLGSLSLIYSLCCRGDREPKVEAPAVAP